MMEDKIYKLYLPLGTKVFLFGFLIFFLGIAVFMFVLPFFTTEVNATPAFFGFFYIGVIGWNLFWVLRFPHEIVLHGDGTIDFKSVLRKVKMHATEIKTIKPANATFGFLVVTGTYTVRLLAQFDNFHEFVAKLKEYNPTIITRGC